MSPRDLADLLLCTGAADLVEALDEPALQQRHGWDLSGWHYDLVPWGVRFSDEAGAEVLALVVIDRRLADAYQELHGRQGRRVILLG